MFARVEDPIHYVGSIFSLAEGEWRQKSHVAWKSAAKEAGLSYDDFDEISESEARTRFPKAF